MAMPGKNWGAGQWAIWAAQAVAVVLGLKYGYAFGVRISGAVLGVVLAANTAVFGALGVTALVDLAQRLRPATREPGPPQR